MSALKDQKKKTIVNAVTFLFLFTLNLFKTEILSFDYYLSSKYYTNTRRPCAFTMLGFRMLTKYMRS
jgi:hypothetical protein